MEILLVLITLGVAAYYFFKGNVGRGIEAVRASIFLRGIQAGTTVAEANSASNVDIENGPTAVIQNAMGHLRTEYGGKQLRMIAEAYRLGMQSKQPLWYQVILNIFYPGDAPQRGVAMKQFDRVTQYGLYSARMKNFFASEGVELTKENLEVCKLLFVMAYMDKILLNLGLIQVNPVTGKDNMFADIYQKAAIIIIITQSIQMLFAEEFPESMLSDPEIKKQRAAVWEGTVKMVLQMDSEKETDEDIGILAFGSQLHRRLGAEDVAILQAIYDDWTYTFYNSGNEKIPNFLVSYQNIVEFSKN